MAGRLAGKRMFITGAVDNIRDAIGLDVH